MAGWGEQGVGGVGRQGMPRKVNIPIVSTNDCRASASLFHGLTSDTTLCAGMLRYYVYDRERDNPNYFVVVIEKMLCVKSVMCVPIYLGRLLYNITIRLKGAEQQVKPRGAASV